MLLVDTYKWLLVCFQCKFLSIQEIVELFHSPDSSLCLSFQILVILLSLSESPGSIAYDLILLDQTCSKSFLGSIHLQGCLSIDIKVWKCLHIRNFHLQLIEVFKMHFPWPVVCSLMCECTEGCCEVCTECRIPIEVIYYTQERSHSFLLWWELHIFQCLDLFGSGEILCFDQQWP